MPSAHNTTKRATIHIYDDEGDGDMIGKYCYT